MQKTTRLFLLAGVVGLALMLAIGLGALTASNASSARQAAPISAPQSLPVSGMVGTLPESTCTFDITTNERTCDLWATTGTITMPTGEPVPIWGFTDVEGSEAQLPGPVIVANQGETLHIVLHNRLLTETVSLFFVGQEGFVPDLVGVIGNSPGHYVLPLNQPGTFLYQAGLTENGARQVAMGMYGGLVVRPTGLPNQAYLNSEVFQKEALLIYSELDPDFNNDPYGFNMQDYKPEYWLINGKSYPETEWIGAAAGETVLLRQANAGLEQKSIGLLGTEQTFIAVDGEPLVYPYTMVAESIGTGQTIDTVVHVPFEAITNTVYPLYESSLHQHNGGEYLTNGQLAFGGILSFIGVTSGQNPPEPGPIVTSFTVDPNDTNAEVDLTLNAVIAVQGTATSVTEYEITIALPDNTTQTITGTVSGSSVNVSETIPVSTMANWPGGTVVFYIRGMDNLGVWGKPGSTVLNFDIVGPEIYGLKMAPNPTNGATDIHLSGTASERFTGNEFVTSAGFTFQGGASSLTLNREGVVVGLSGDIPAAQITGLTDGEYPVTVWAEDFHGNLNDTAVVTLTVDKTGPAASGVTLTPNYLDFSGALSITNVRLDAVVADPVVNGITTPLFKVWAYIEDPAAMFEVFPSDGMFDTNSEAIYFNIPVTNFAKLGTGIHSVSVVGQDEAGNMGTPVSGSIEVFIPEVDLFGPVISNLSISPNPTGGANFVQLAALASDPGLVAGAEWYVGADPGWGNAYPMDGAFGATDVTISAEIRVSGWRPGNYNINVRARDMEGNWSSIYTVVLQVTRNNQNIILVETFSDLELLQWDNVVGNVTLAQPAQIPAGEIFTPAQVYQGMQAGLDGENPAYLQYNLPGETNFQISFYFDPNSIDMDGGQHQIFTGLDHLKNLLFGIEVDEDAVVPHEYYIRAWVLTTAGIQYTPAFELLDAPHKLTLKWDPSANEILVFTVDDSDFIVDSTASTASISGVTASDGDLYQIWFGPSIIEGANTQGIEYFDNINAIRQVTNLLYLPLITH